MLLLGEAKNTALLFETKTIKQNKQHLYLCCLHVKRGETSVPIKIKIHKSYEVKVPVEVKRPYWQEFLHY